MKQFTHNIFLLQKLKTKTINDKRHYITPENKVYPSVTTITGIISEDSIRKWRATVGYDLSAYQTTQASIIGTELHEICETYLSNKNLKKFKHLTPLAHFSNIKKQLNKIDNIHGLECTVYSDKYKLAGKVDCVAEYDGVLSIIDFKTTKKQKPKHWLLNYFCQATAYREAWQERTGEKINQIVIIISGLDGSQVTYIEDPDDYIYELKNTILKYNNSIS